MKNFAITTKWILENYDRYNKKYWNGELPRIDAKISRSKYQFGYASFRMLYGRPTGFKIYMSCYYNLTEKSWTNTLLHEMIHIADYYYHPEHFIVGNRKVKGYDAHGPIFFLKHAERLNNDGWNISRFKEDSEMIGSCLSEKTKAKLEKTYILVVFADYKKTENTYVQKIQKRQIPELKSLLEKFNFTIKGIYETNYEKYSETRCSMKRYYNEKVDFEIGINTLSKIKGFIFKKLEI